MGVEVDMTIWWVASVTPPLKNPGYAPALCFPLVSVFTCFDFVYISFYFQISQEKIKPSLLPHRTVSCGQRVQVSVMLWFETFWFQRHLWSLIYPACCWLTNVLHHPRWGFCQLPHLCPGLHSLSKICLLWFILFFFFDLQLVRWCIWGSVMLRCWQEQALYNAPLNACQHRTLLRNSPL